MPTLSAGPKDITGTELKPLEYLKGKEALRIARMSAEVSSRCERYLALPVLENCRRIFIDGLSVSGLLPGERRLYRSNGTIFFHGCRSLHI